MEHKSKYEVIDELTAEVLGLMEDLYQSGFDTVHDATLRDMKRAAELAGQYGCFGLAELLSGLYDGIS